jgi:GGDEF domain-containing protein
MGGDEFTILLEDIGSLNDATRLVRHLEGAFREPVKIETRELYVTLSTGSFWSGGIRARRGAPARRRHRMYRAKAHGGASAPSSTRRCWRACRSSSASKPTCTRP